LGDVVVLAEFYILAVDAYFSSEVYGAAYGAFALPCLGSFMREAS